MSSSITENLEEAFVVESQTNQKYYFFSNRAEKKGYPNIAPLFRTTAEVEEVHSKLYPLALETAKRS